MRTFTFSLLLSILFCGLGHAAPAYGTKMPAQGKFFGGLQSYAVLDRDLKGDNGEMHSLQYFALLSYGLMDWLSLDLKGGVGNIHQRGGNYPDLNYATYLGGGYGFRVKLYDHDATRVVAGFQHISIHPYQVAVGPNHHKTVLDDWQFSALVSHDIFNITPYLGARWSRMNKIYWIEDERNRIKSDKDLGLIAGFDLPLCERVWFNVEGQFLDGAALAGSIHFSF